MKVLKEQAISGARAKLLATRSLPAPANDYRPKLKALESLRGLLALWVVAAHVAGRSLLDADIKEAHLVALTEPLLPVYVFMMLSGFVIFLMLDHEREEYVPYLIRRFFRLAPLYYVVLGVSALLVGTQLHALESLPWVNRSVSDSITVHRETLASFWSNLSAHLLLLQGVIPEALLRDVNFTFLSHGWSVSLEWQFYLVAPVFFYLAIQREYLLLISTAIVLGALQALSLFGVGFFPNQFHYFVIGIASYYLYAMTRQKPKLAGWARDVVLAAILAAVAFILPEPWPVIIWLLVLDTLLMQKVGASSTISKVIGRILKCPPFLYLGRVSYSIYLVHIPILYVVFHGLTHYAPGLTGWTFLGVALPLVLMTSIGVASLTYRLIELPGIRLGAYFAMKRGAYA